MSVVKQYESFCRRCHRINGCEKWWKLNRWMPIGDRHDGGKNFWQSEKASEKEMVQIEDAQKGLATNVQSRKTWDDGVCRIATGLCALLFSSNNGNYYLWNIIIIIWRIFNYENYVAFGTAFIQCHTVYKSIEIAQHSNWRVAILKSIRIRMKLLSINLGLLWQQNDVLVDARTEKKLN